MPHHKNPMVRRLASRWLRRAWMFDEVDYDGSGTYESTNFTELPVKHIHGRANPRQVDLDALWKKQRRITLGYCDELVQLIISEDDWDTPEDAYDDVITKARYIERRLTSGRGRYSEVDYSYDAIYWIYWEDEKRWGCVAAVYERAHNC